ncbi:hypothetical protein OPV22_014894 [Ensete ventricosum]|uniref:C2 domain-containing protein n=1 Tax=Ensete ventricosum TaxID=4639 RepID=A0AAV8R4A9_ENSVE|nr:hypothetical protein OPV22_014894 [Ensete ventricosum]
MGWEDGTWFPKGYAIQDPGGGGGCGRRLQLHISSDQSTINSQKHNNKEARQMNWNTEFTLRLHGDVVDVATM